MEPSVLKACHYSTPSLLLTKQLDKWEVFPGLRESLLVDPLHTKDCFWHHHAASLYKTKHLLTLMMTGELASTSLSNQVEDLTLARQCIMVVIDRLALSPVRLFFGGIEG
ncbi:hypothetical protein FOTG_05105 [Fusarium oxysporum f. sp. vasinfectum 25433]|uniref:Uncharacterized protein n=1 Tax=Fusarium oxysporum f. sp. vasinfectum 25433 TaxID=1089449 RepID=X0LVQ1_FUSOX|nr:hypothetical protein FOTG_05105 [Fusarium oxysporum f. sp. vasinfectum 25433]